MEDYELNAIHCAEIALQTAERFATEDHPLDDGLVSFIKSIQNNIERQDLGFADFTPSDALKSVMDIVSTMETPVTPVVETPAEETPVETPAETPSETPSETPTV